MTNIRKRPPMGQAPPVKMAKYELSLRSTVTKANSGKLEKLGTFHERLEEMRKASQSNNFFTSDFNSRPILTELASEEQQSSGEDQYGVPLYHQ